MEVLRSYLWYKYRRLARFDAWSFENGMHAPHRYSSWNNNQSLEACEKAYLKLSNEIFGKQQSGPYLYNADVLQAKIEELLGESKDAVLFDDRSDPCRTFVVTVRHEVVDGPAVLLRSYSIDGTEIQCSIVQAARATTAAPTFFVPASIGLNMYIDGGIGYNNPAEQAILEANRIWPSRPIGCLLSLGTGKNIPISGESEPSHVVRIFASRIAEKLTVAEYCTKLATGCQAVHLHLLENNQLAKGKFKDRYYRFNVEYGAVGIELDEWKKLSALSARTDAYLADPSESRRLVDCAKLLRSDEEIVINMG